MIIPVRHLQGIKSGSVQLAFRRWKKPAHKKGSLINTALGRIRIDDVSVMDEKKLTKADALKAGFENLSDLLAALGDYPGDLYRIGLSYYSEDPRITLRQTPLTDETFAHLSAKLQRLDHHKAWTIKYLKLIRDHPKLRAADLCKRSGQEKDKLKVNIRKLKNLGLTISHEIGYEISPLGRAFLERKG